MNNRKNLVISIIFVIWILIWFYWRVFGGEEPKSNEAGFILLVISIMIVYFITSNLTKNK